MDNYFLEVAQILERHPMKSEKEKDKIRYLKLLEYFANNYSKEKEWSQAILHLYKIVLLSNEKEYEYNSNFDSKKNLKKLLKTRLKPFNFFTYRYCFLIDCIFISAYNDKDYGERILKELIECCKKSFHNNMIQLFEYLYNTSLSIYKFEKTENMIELWNRNKAFLEENPVKVIITANMSAGKSTLLNALVGRKISKTQNEACTSKVHYIKNKPYEDNFCYELDYEFDVNANLEKLMEDNEENKSNNIEVGTYFRTPLNKSKRIWLIDTPGVNSSQNIQHKELSEDIIKENNADLLIYLLNGENIGTDDDRKHLTFIYENYKDKILFVINKLDRFRKGEDSIEKTISEVSKELKEIGFISPKVVPVSSYAGYLSKIKLYGEVLDEDEIDEFNRMYRKLKKEEYQFDRYYPSEIEDEINIDNSEEATLLKHSGILQLEQIIYNLNK